jgi:hypothetical protein
MLATSSSNHGRFRENGRQDRQREGGSQRARRSAKHSRKSAPAIQRFGNAHHRRRIQSGSTQSHRSRREDALPSSASPMRRPGSRRTATPASRAGRGEDRHAQVGPSRDARIREQTHPHAVSAETDRPPRNGSEASVMPYTVPNHALTATMPATRPVTAGRNTTYDDRQTVHPEQDAGIRTLAADTTGASHPPR